MIFETWVKKGYFARNPNSLSILRGGQGPVAVKGPLKHFQYLTRVWPAMEMWGILDMR